MKTLFGVILTLIILDFAMYLTTGVVAQYGCVDTGLPGYGHACGPQLTGNVNVSFWACVGFLIFALATMLILKGRTMGGNEAPEVARQSGDAQGAIPSEQGDRANSERVLATCSFRGVQTVGAGAIACAGCGKPLPGATEVMPAVPKKMRSPFGGWELVAVAGVLIVGLFVVLVVFPKAFSGGGSSATAQQQRAQETASAWPQEPMDFKGLKFGMRLTEAKQAAGLKDCYSSEHRCDCSIHADPITFNVSFEYGKLDRITGDFTATDFDQLEEVFTSKYGKPTLANDSMIQNAFGALFQQRELFWSGQRMSISLDRFARSYSEGIPGGGKKYDLTKGKLYVLPEKDIGRSAKQSKDKKKHILD